MYVIYVEKPVSSWKTEYGFFTECYQAKVNGEKGIWIGFTNRKEEFNQVRKFKTYSEAERKVKFLQDKIDYNAFLWDMKLTIKEIGDDMNIVKY